MERRTLIRLLIGLGIGIPILVEGLTFLGLLRSRLTGGDGGGTPTLTPRARVGIGDEFLPETPQAETLSTASLQAGEDEWSLTLTVEVDNPADHAYELRLGTVILDGGDRVDGRFTTDRVPAGESGVVTGQWRLPTGATPTAVEAVGIQYDDGETAAAVEKAVPLANIPVRGGS